MTMTSQTPTLSTIRRESGVAGQIAYTTEVTYPGEPAERVTFVGSAYGGPVLMVLPSGQQIFVTDPARHGEFSPRWVRRFFGVEV